jgi:beta-lactamase regulating signal transducer with metallopeptidase domain
MNGEEPMMYALVTWLLALVPWSLLATAFFILLTGSTRWFSASARQALGLGALIALPVLPALWLNLVHFSAQSVTPHWTQAGGSYVWTMEPFWVGTIGAVWMTGMILRFILLGHSLVSQHRLKSFFKEVPVNLQTDWNTIQSASTWKRTVRLAQSDRVTQPGFLGLGQPWVVLPRGADTWSESERQAVLWHEMAHAQRYDDLALFFQKIVQAVMWWNPLTGWMAGKINDWREEAADEWALHHWRKPRAFANALLALACEESGLEASLAWHQSRPAVARRLEAVRAWVDFAAQRLTPFQAGGSALVLLALTLWSLGSLPSFQLVAPSSVVRNDTVPAIVSPVTWQVQELPQTVSTVSGRWVMLTGPEVKPGQRAAVLCRLNDRGRVVAAYPFYQRETSPEIPRL